MIEQTVSIVTRYGRQPVFAACPEAPGRYPGIILYMDAPGFREELCQMGRRIASRGYFCLVPDLYYRLGTLRFDVPRRNDAMSAVFSLSASVVLGRKMTGMSEIGFDTGTLCVGGLGFVGVASVGKIADWRRFAVSCRPNSAPTSSVCSSG